MPLLIHQLSYAGIFIFLGGSGIFAPIPEEVTLLTSGYLIAQGFLNPLIVLPVAVCGILIGDSVLFGLAKFGSRYARKVHDHLVTYGLNRTWVFSPDHPLRAVFLMRFVTGFRMISPVFAGLNGASWLAFLVTDFAALMLFVPSMMWLGFHFHATFLAFLATFEIARHALFWSLIVLMGGSVLSAHPRIHRFVRRFHTGKEGRMEEQPHDHA